MTTVMFSKVIPEFSLKHLNGTVLRLTFSYVFFFNASLLCMQMFCDWPSCSSVESLLYFQGLRVLSQYIALLQLETMGVVDKLNQKKRNT